MSDPTDISSPDQRGIRRSAADKLPNSITPTEDVSAFLPVGEHKELQLRLTGLVSAPEVEYPQFSQLAPSFYALASSNAVESSARASQLSRRGTRPLAASGATGRGLQFESPPQQQVNVVGRGPTLIAVLGLLVIGAGLALLAFRLFEGAPPNVYTGLSLALGGIAFVAFALVLASRGLAPPPDDASGEPHRAGRGHLAFTNAGRVLSEIGFVTAPQRGGQTRARRGVAPDAPLRRKISVGFRTGGFGLLVEPIDRSHPGTSSEHTSSGPVSR